MVVLGESPDVGHQQDVIRAVETIAQVTTDVDHALEFFNRMAAVVIISAAEVEGVIPSKQFGGMHHQTYPLHCRQHFIEVDLEILVAEMDFNKVEIAAGSKALDVVITNR
ncbi:MAG: hypothetical protein MK142_17260 [Pseudomonadales bacterium]|nr:hypothetical protein [Pseudomonadales bacterium]